MSDNYFVGKLEKLGIGKIYRLEFFHLNVINFLLFVNNFSYCYSTSTCFSSEDRYQTWMMDDDLTK